jgi:hypothetical protein
MKRGLFIYLSHTSFPDTPKHNFMEQEKKYFFRLSLQREQFLYPSLFLRCTPWEKESLMGAHLTGRSYEPPKTVWPLMQEGCRLLAWYGAAQLHIQINGIATGQQPIHTTISFQSHLINSLNSNKPQTKDTQIMADAGNGPHPCAGITYM